VEFYTKNKLEKLVHLVGFIIRIYHDARSPERLNLDTLSFESHLLTLVLLQTFQKCGPLTTSPFHSFPSRNSYYTLVEL